MFWTKAIAGVWMVAGIATHGIDLYDWLRDQLFGAPVRPAVALALPTDNRCPPLAVPRLPADDTLRVPDFDLGADGQVDGLQYTNPATGKFYAAVVVTGRAGGAVNFVAGTYYLLPEEVIFLPQMLESKSDSLPYVSDALYARLGQLACVAALSGGQVRVNKALLSVSRQRYWESERQIVAEGLGVNSVHLQIVDTKSQKATPWDNTQVDAAVAKARLNVPSPERFRAYVRLST